MPIIENSKSNENEVHFGTNNVQIRDIKVRQSSAKSAGSSSSLARKAAFTERLESMSREELSSKYRRDLKKVVEIRRSSTNQMRNMIDSNIRVVKSDVSLIEEEALQPLSPWFQAGLYFTLGLFLALVMWVFE